MGEQFQIQLLFKVIVNVIPSPDNGPNLPFV